MIREILDAVSDKVPRLIKELMGSLYSKDAGTNMGQSVGAFYKELVESGIPAADALGMAKVYLFSLDMKQQIKSQEEQLVRIMPMMTWNKRLLAGYEQVQRYTGHYNKIPRLDG